MSGFDGGGSRLIELSVKYIASRFSLFSHFIPIEMDLYNVKPLPV